MATRLYVSQAAPAITPTPSSGWEDTANFLRRTATITVASFDDTGTPTTSGTGNANDDVLWYQMIYGPLATQTLTGTFKGQISAREANAAADARIQVIIRTIQSDGSTVRGTNLAMSTAALSHEFVVDAGNRRNITMPLGGATSLTSVGIQAGDYLVIEVGFRNHGTNTGAIRGKWTWDGADSSDAAENETTQMPANVRGWMEFSQTLIPYTAASAGNASATVAANNATNTIKPTLTAAIPITVAANNATISNVAPPRTITIDSSDFTGDIMYSSFALTECANRGEVGTGGFDLFDPSSTFSIPAMKGVVMEEPAAGQSNKRVFTGFTHDRTMEALQDGAGAARTWGVECVDLNSLANDFVLSDADSADRPSETDYVRVAWLLTSVFNSVGGVGVGVVPNANTQTMEATDYRGRKPADVLAECSEATNKLWFVYDYGAGRKLYYDLATNTSLTATLSIADDGTRNGTTIFAPQGGVVVKKSPDRIYSTVHLTYNGGTVTVSDAGVASSYRQREAAILDASISDATLATAKANALLDGAAAEITEIEGLEIVVPLANVNDVRAGQRVQITLERQGIASPTYHRVIRKTVEPEGPSYYRISLDLASDVLASANGQRGGDQIWPQKSNANDDGATVIVDRNGINIIDGAITIVNSAATVIIDGESEIFQILTSATHSCAGDGSDTDTLTGLGALSETPVAILIHSNANTVGSGKQTGFAFYQSDDDVYVATTSGGAVTTGAIKLDQLVNGDISLNGSSQAVVSIISTLGPGGSGGTYYQTYYVLDKTAF